MQNYEIFTQIGVLQRFNAKEENQQEMQQKVAKAGKDECCDKFHHCHDKNSRQEAEEMLQQSEHCHDKHLEVSLRKHQKPCHEISQLCRDIINAEDN